MADQNAALSPAQRQAVTALDKPARNPADLRALFARPDVIEQVKMVIPKHMKPERMVKILLSACLSTPMLMEVNQLSLLRILGQVSELGLEPGGALGHVYLIPFRNRKAGRVDVNVIIGYRGYLELMRRSGEVKQVETHIAFKGEKFDLVYGLEGTRKLEHVPSLDVVRKPENASWVYCIIRFKDGSEHVEVMAMDEVRAIRDRSQAWKFKPNEGPWHDDFLQMARKTVIRRASHYVPLAIEKMDQLQDAMTLDADNTIQGEMVQRPALVAGSEDISAALAAPRAGEEEEPPHDPTTGEVQEEQAQPQAEETEPEAGTVDHLLWRIRRAQNSAELKPLKDEAFKLSKDEPRRLEVSGAISERTKQLAAQVQP